jgi:hypothetical protein
VTIASDLLRGYGLTLSYDSSFSFASFPPDQEMVGQDTVTITTTIKQKDQDGT